MGLYSIPGLQTKSYKEEDEVRWDLGRVASARGERKAWFKLIGFPCLRDLMGKNRNPRDTDDVFIALIMADCISAAAALNIRRPDFSLMPVQPDDIEDRIAEGKAPLILDVRRMIDEAILRRCMHDDDGVSTVKDHLDMCKWDSLWAYGMGKVVPSGSWMENSDAGKPIRLKSGELAFDPETGEPILKPDVELVDQHYRIHWVDCRKYFIHVKSAANRIGARFEGEDGESDIDVMKSMGIYNMKNARRSAKDPDADPFDMSEDDPMECELSKYADRIGMKTGNGLQKDDPWNNTLKYHFIHDHENQRFKIVSKTMPKQYILNVAVPPGVEGSIYAPLMYTKPVSYRFYPTPPIWMLRDPTQEYTDVSRHMKIVRRGAVRKVFVTKGAYPDEVLSQLASVIDLEFCYVDNAGQAAKDFVLAKTTEAGHTPTDLVSGDKALRDFSRCGGRPSESRGEASADTATQSIQIANQANLRDDDRRDRFSDFLSMLGSKMLSLIQATLSVNIAVKIMGENIREFWWKIEDRSELEGKFKVDVKVESLGPENKGQKLKLALQTADVLAKIPGVRLDGNAVADDLTALAGMGNRWVVKAEPTPAPAMPGAPAKPEAAGPSVTPQVPQPGGVLV